MTLALPSLEPTDARCPDCRGALTFDSPPWCYACLEPELAQSEALYEAATRERRAVQREEAIQADHEAARKRARTWQLGRPVQS